MFMKKNIVILTGAGMSAESGIKTFRDEDGLWEGHDVMKVASPQAWEENKELVLDFYNQRRRQLHEVQPNAAHKALVKLEEKFTVDIITQNVDDLHERAGSQQVTHLHGELFKVRSTVDPQLIQVWKKDLHLGDRCEKGSQLRPHVVWFGEAVPELTKAVNIVEKAAVVIVIGTSMQVYPAAGLIEYAPKDCPIYFIDPNPTVAPTEKLQIIPEKAVKGVPELVQKLIHSTL